MPEIDKQSLTELIELVKALEVALVTIKTILEYYNQDVINKDDLN